MTTESSISTYNMKKNLKIWGRNFNIPIDFDIYDGENPSGEQISRLNRFLSKPEILSDMKKISDFCAKDGASITNNKVDNIFKYVHPRTLLVSNSSNEKYIALLCDYKFDEEHGIAVIFKNNKCVDIVQQDEVL